MGIVARETLACHVAKTSTHIYTDHMAKPKISVTTIFEWMYKLVIKKQTCYPCLHSLAKTEANDLENLRADQWKPEMQSRIFTCSRILTNIILTFRTVKNEINTLLVILHFCACITEDTRTSVFTFFPGIHLSRCFIFKPIFCLLFRNTNRLKAEYW